MWPSPDRHRGSSGSGGHLQSRRSWRRSFREARRSCSCRASSDLFTTPGGDQHSTSHPSIREPTSCCRRCDRTALRLFFSRRDRCRHHSRPGLSLQVPEMRERTLVAFPIRSSNTPASGRRAKILATLARPGVVQRPRCSVALQRNDRDLRRHARSAGGIGDRLSIRRIRFGAL